MRMRREWTFYPFLQLCGQFLFTDHSGFYFSSLSFLFAANESPNTAHFASRPQLGSDAKIWVRALSNRKKKEKKCWKKAFGFVWVHCSSTCEITRTAEPKAQMSYCILIFNSRTLIPFHTLLKPNNLIYLILGCKQQQVRDKLFHRLKWGKIYLRLVFFYCSFQIIEQKYWNND